MNSDPYAKAVAYLRQSGAIRDPHTGLWQRGYQSLDTCPVESMRILKAAALRESVAELRDDRGLLRRPFKV